MLTVLLFLSWVLLPARSPPSSRSLRLCPWTKILLHGPLDICLDLLPAASPPPVQKRDAQPKFWKHRGAHTEVVCNFYAEVLFCTLLRSFEDLRSFALICVLLCSFARFCVRPPLEWPCLGTPDNHCAKPLPEDVGDEILHFCPHLPAWRTRWIFGGKFSFIFSQGKRLKICHSPNSRKFHHIFHGKERNLSPATRSGGDFTQQSGSRTRLRIAALFRACSEVVLDTIIAHNRVVELPRWFRTRRLSTPTTVCGCGTGRDRPFQSHSLSQRGSYSGRGGEDSVAFNRLMGVTKHKH